LDLKPSMLVWAEGPEKPKGKSRIDLHQADEFVIYTTPPSSAELHTALEIVKPKTIYLIAISPAAEKADEFLSRLAGMVKFAINQRGGKVKISELAVVTSHRETTIRLGLNWLAAGGHLIIKSEGDELQLAEGDGFPDQYLQRELFISIKGSLEETAAYRNFFTKAESKSLI